METPKAELYLTIYTDSQNPAIQRLDISFFNPDGKEFESEDAPPLPDGPQNDLLEALLDGWRVEYILQGSYPKTQRRWLRRQADGQIMRNRSLLPPDMPCEGPWYTRLRNRRGEHYLTHHFFRTGHDNDEIVKWCAAGNWRYIYCYAYAPEHVPATTAEGLAAQFTHDQAAFDLEFFDLQGWNDSITVDTEQMPMENVLNILREMAERSNIKLVFCRPETFRSSRREETL